MELTYDDFLAQSFCQVTDSMDKLCDEEIFDIDKASKLFGEYNFLVGLTCNNYHLHERDRHDWAIAVAYAYEPSVLSLSLRTLGELQK